MKVKLTMQPYANLAHKKIRQSSETIICVQKSSLCHSKALTQRVKNSSIITQAHKILLLASPLKSSERAQFDVLFFIAKTLADCTRNSHTIILPSASANSAHTKLFLGTSFFSQKNSTKGINLKSSPGMERRKNFNLGSEI